MFEIGSEIAQAFSHFSYVRSGGQIMVTDIQGVYNAEESVLLLADPQILSLSQGFGPGDLGVRGMIRFFATHTCN